MKRNDHITDQALLLFTDGELSGRDSSRICAHLEACSQCRKHFDELQRTIRDAAQAYTLNRDRVDDIADIAGPRAVLKARLAQLALESPGSRWRYPRFAQGIAYACALAVLVSIGVGVSMRRATNERITSSQPLPDPSITPGSTRQVSLAELCSADRDEVVRSVPGAVQQKIFQEYGLNGISSAEFEVDYLITPGLGGSDDVRNLWPEPHSNTAWNSYVKDQLEDRLHHMVCERKLSLKEAQKDIASDWIAAYKKYFHTEQPLATSLPPSLSKI
jgi:hypothetical protein